MILGPFEKITFWGLDPLVWFFVLMVLCVVFVVLARGICEEQPAVFFTGFESILHM
jgi:hypothetical protein